MATKGNQKSTSVQTKTAPGKSGKEAATKPRTRQNSKKTVSFDTKSCRRSLLFSDDEEEKVPIEAATVRSKRQAANLTDGFYKE